MEISLDIAKAEELAHQRPAKLSKIEMASLHNLLVDETPSIEILTNLGHQTVRFLGSKCPWTRIPQQFEPGRMSTSRLCC